MHIPTYLTVFPLFRHTPQDTVGRLGEPAVLNCSALAIPPPDYEWSVNGLNINLDGTRLIADNGSLLFSELVREDSGSYVCTASNQYGEILSPSAELTVLGE